MLLESALTGLPLSSSASLMVKREGDVIAWHVGQTQLPLVKRLFFGIYNHTIGYLLNDSSEVRCFKWKIKRYEDILMGMQSSFKEFFLEENDSFRKVWELSNSDEGELEWKKQIKPVIHLLNKQFRSDKERFSLEYLIEIRRVFTEDFLDNLRAAAQWSHTYQGLEKEKLDDANLEGAKYIDAMCYLLYTRINLNRRCQKVFKNFIQLAEKSLSIKTTANEHPLLNDSKYSLVRHLLLRHYQIQAVPTAAKAPLLKQWANSARGHLNGFVGLTFDPNRQSNPVHVLFENIIEILPQHKGMEKSTYVIKNIAMGSPTIENGSGIAEINPEFSAMLRYYALKGLVHVCFNHQNFIPQSWIEGDESVRCKAIHGLADKFKGTFYAITLSQNSIFYHQHGHVIRELDALTVKSKLLAQLLDGKSKEMGNYLPKDLVALYDLGEWMTRAVERIHSEEFNSCLAFDLTGKLKFIQRFHDVLREHVEELIATSSSTCPLGYCIYHPSTDKFKRELIEQMFDRSAEVTGNCLPVDLVKSFDLREWGRQLADDIHAINFDRRDGLTIEERRIFIRLFYNNLTRYILIRLKPYSYNKSCKDRADRAVASDAEGFAEDVIDNDLEDKEEIVDFFETQIFARAIIVRKRAIIEERLERLIETTSFMLDYKVKMKKLRAKLFPMTKMTINIFSSNSKN